MIAAIPLRAVGGAGNNRFVLKENRQSSDLQAKYEDLEKLDVLRYVPTTKTTGWVSMRYIPREVQCHEVSTITPDHCYHLPANYRPADKLLRARLVGRTDVENPSLWTLPEVRAVYDVVSEADAG